VARRLRRCVRRSDTVCRQGGDEFIVLLPIVERAEQACHVARKIMAACEAPIVLDGEPRRIGVSGGIALYPQHGEGFEELARNADVALYAAKRAGRGQFMLSDGPGRDPVPAGATATAPAAEAEPPPA